MSNHYFQFKQFNIQQDQCAMKVSTDACIQGAWTPINYEVSQVLDIGAGTALLSMMLAQRNSNLLIDALEIDELASVQAKQNIKLSPFAHQINLHQVDARLWNGSQLYDFIICNPPFFSNSLKSNNELRTQARHNTSLTFVQLAKTIVQNLKTTGYASLLLPNTEIENWNFAAKNEQLFTHHCLLIKPFVHSKPNRIVLILGKTESEITEEELVIYQEPKVYTEAFKHLMKDYYLQF